MTADVETIRKAITAIHPQTFPEEAKAALAAELPRSVEGTGGMLFCAALQDWRERVEKDLAEAKASFNETATELDSCKQSLAEAEKLVQEATLVAEDAATKTRDFAKAAKDAETEHSKAEKQGAAQAKRWVSLHEEHERSKSVAVGPLQILKDGGWSDEEMRTASLEAVESLLVDIGVEKVLSSCVEPALGIKPEERKRFDNLASEVVCESVTKKIAELTAVVEAESGAERSARAELLGLWAIGACAREELAKAEVVEVEASAKRKLANGDLQSAQKRLKVLDERRTMFDSIRTDCEQTLELIKETLAATKRLRDAPAQEKAANESGNISSTEKLSEEAADEVDAEKKVP